MPRSKEERMKDCPEGLEDIELWSLPSVDSKLVRQLDMVGVHTFEAMAILDEYQALSVAELTEVQYENLRTQCMEKINMKPGVFAASQIPPSQYIPTGSKDFDTLLSGGYKVGEVTQIAGLWGMGKTTACSTAIVRTKEILGLPSLFIHTETQQPFDPQFVARIAATRNVPFDLTKDLFVSSPIMYLQQEGAMKDLDLYIKNLGIKLLVVDSIGSHLAAEYLARGTLATRQQILRRDMRRIARMARVFNIAAIVTNQVIADPTPMHAPQKLAMGEVMQYAAGTIIWIRNMGKAGSFLSKGIKDTGEREVTLYKSLGRAVSTVIIKIDDKGIDDV